MPGGRRSCRGDVLPGGRHRRSSERNNPRGGLEGERQWQRAPRGDNAARDVAADHLSPGAIAAATPPLLHLMAAAPPPPVEMCRKENEAHPQRLCRLRRCEKGMRRRVSR